VDNGRAVVVVVGDGGGDGGCGGDRGLLAFLTRWLAGGHTGGRIDVRKRVET